MCLSVLSLFKASFLFLFLTRFIIFLNSFLHSGCKYRFRTENSKLFKDPTHLLQIYSAIHFNLNLRPVL